MATSFFGGRSRHDRHASRSSRTTPSSRHQSTSRSKEAEEEVVPKPERLNIEELRRRRLQYLALSPGARRRAVLKSTTLNPAPTAATTSRTKQVRADHRSRRTRNRHDFSRPLKTVTSSSEDYVYGNASEPTMRRSGGAHASSSSRRSQRNDLTSHRHTLPPVVESEVAPDDSISQVGIQQATTADRYVRAKRSTPKRSTTSSAKLPSTPEKQSKKNNSTTTSPHSAKRHSQPSLLGLLRRNTAPAAPVPTRLVECLTCAADDVPSVKSAKLSCGHRMCHDCLKRVFEMSVKDPAHMPPKCCKNDHIPLQHVDKLFDLRFKKLWNRKYQEFHTKNRIYCPAPKCGEWIKPTHIHSSHGMEYAQCPRCSMKVCTLCNGKRHKSRDCPKDPEIAKLVAQAKDKGWQSCFNCNAMVELKEGCNHMTCRCRAEFCMICGAKWKTCECAWFNYSQVPNPDRLMDWRVPEPVQEIYQRVFGQNNFQPPAPPLGPGPANIAPPEQAAPTYADEIEWRRRQERSDADLARRLQLASLLNPDEPTEPRAQRRHQPDMWGVGNGVDHFMNHNFVQDGADVIMNAFGDAALGQRGERSSGRRRRAPRTAHADQDAGLVHNFLGDESVIGMRPSNSRSATPR